MDPSKLVPPGTNFLINTDPPELILLQNMDSLWKIWTTSHRWKNVDAEHISFAKLGPMVYLGGFWGFWKLLRPVSSAARNVLYSHSQPYATVSFRAHCAKFVTNTLFDTLRGAAEAYSWKADIRFCRYATVNSTNVLSSHWFSFVWLVYSGNKFFRVGPNISEKFVPGGNQI